MKFQIDNTSLNKTLNWLKETQGEDGCFEMVGKVFNKGMKVSKTEVYLYGQLEGRTSSLKGVKNWY